MHMHVYMCINHVFVYVYLNSRENVLLFNAMLAQSNLIIKYCRYTVHIYIYIYIYIYLSIYF